MQLHSVTESQTAKWTVALTSMASCSRLQIFWTGDDTIVIYCLTDVVVQHEEVIPVILKPGGWLDINHLVNKNIYSNKHTKHIMIMVSLVYNHLGWVITFVMNCWCYLSSLLTDRFLTFYGIIFTTLQLESCLVSYLSGKECYNYTVFPFSVSPPTLFTILLIVCGRPLFL